MSTETLLLMGHKGRYFFIELFKFHLFVHPDPQIHKSFEDICYGFRFQNTDFDWWEGATEYASELEQEGWRVIDISEHD